MKFFQRIKDKSFVFASLSFVFVLTSAIIFIAVKKQPWEYVTAFLAGIFWGNFDKAKKWVVVISFLTVIGAIIFDPYIKPLVDKMLGVNTVGSLGGSLLINSFVFLLFWMGYLSSEKIKEKLAKTQ